MQRPTRGGGCVECSTAVDGDARPREFSCPVTKGTCPSLRRLSGGRQVASRVGRGMAASPCAWCWHMGTPPVPGATPGTMPSVWDEGKGTVRANYGTASRSEDTCLPGSRLCHQPTLLQPSKSLDEKCLRRKRLSCLPKVPQIMASSGC